MANQIKPIVNKSDTFELLDMRIGKVINANPKVWIKNSKSYDVYVMTVDFGKFGIKLSVGQFTKHTKDEIIGKSVLGILNLGVISCQFSDGESIDSEVFIVGTQYPKADSGEATFVTPIANSKVGSKLF